MVVSSPFGAVEGSPPFGAVVGSSPFGAVVVSYPFPSSFGAVVFVVGLTVSGVEGVVNTVSLFVALAFTFVARWLIVSLVSCWSPEAFSCAVGVLPAASHLTKTKTVARVTDSDNS